jgi:hypothetical protein
VKPQDELPLIENKQKQKIGKKKGSPLLSTWGVEGILKWRISVLLSAGN